MKKVFIFSLIMGMASLVGIPGAFAQIDGFTSSATASPAELDVGETTEITATITNNGSTLSNGVVDIEIFDSSGVKAHQEFFLGVEILEDQTKDFVTDWVPENEGTFIVHVGVFGQNWSGPLHWNYDAETIVVGGDEPTANGSVTLVDSSIVRNRGIVLSAFFQTAEPPSEPVLLDLEVYRNGEKFAQEFWDNVVLETTDMHERQLVLPLDLPEGTYEFDVGIFNPGWSGLISWHDAVQEFTIEGEGDDADVELVGRIIRPALIDAGETSQLCGEFQSFGADSTVLLDLELYNSENVKMHQEFFDNTLLEDGVPETLCTTTPSELTAGEYTFRVGIFEPGWTGLMKWYNNVGSLTIE